MSNSIELSAQKLSIRHYFKAVIGPNDVIKQCLHSFVDGAWWSFHRAIQEIPAMPRHISRSQFPDIILDEIPSDKCVEYRMPPRHEIAISLPFLRTIRDERITISEPVSNVTEEVSSNPFLALPLINYFGIIGVEEGDHAGYFAQNESPLLQTLDEVGRNLREYFSQPHELRAQIAVREYSLQNFPPTTHNLLMYAQEFVGIRS
jgi:hypothetical protein